MRSLLAVCAAALLAPAVAWAADDILIADFEGKDWGGWKVEGNAFGPGPARGALSGQMAVSKDLVHWQGETLPPGKNLLAGVGGELFEIRAEFEVGDAAEFGFSIRGTPVTYDVKAGEIVCKIAKAPLKAPLKPEGGRVRLYCVSYGGASQAGWHGHAPLRDHVPGTASGPSLQLAAASHPPKTDAVRASPYSRRPHLHRGLRGRRPRVYACRRRPPGR